VRARQIAVNEPDGPYVSDLATEKRRSAWTHTAAVCPDIETRGSPVGDARTGVSIASGSRQGPLLSFDLIDHFHVRCSNTESVAATASRELLVPIAPSIVLELQCRCRGRRSRLDYAAATNREGGVIGSRSFNAAAGPTRLRLLVASDPRPSRATSLLAGSEIPQIHELVTTVNWRTCPHHDAFVTAYGERFVSTLERLLKPLFCFAKNAHATISQS
jgi:hypothetical protein